MKITPRAKVVRSVMRMIGFYGLLIDPHDAVVVLIFAELITLHYVLRSSKPINMRTWR